MRYLNEWFFDIGLVLIVCGTSSRLFRLITVTDIHHVAARRLDPHELH